MQIPHGWFLLTLLFIFTPSFGQSIDIENSHAHLRVTDWSLYRTKKYNLLKDKV